MKPSRILLCAAAASLCAAALISPSKAGSAVAFAAPVPATAAWQQSGPALPSAPAVPAGGTAAAQGTLPTSVFPHNNNACSVQAPDPAAICSVGAATARRCSAYCDEAQLCSALADPNGPDVAFCSSLGRQKGLCSVLQPARTQVGPSRCSAFNDSPFADQIACSVLQPGGPKQACSAENPSQFRNECSAFNSLGPEAVCSVRNGGPQFRNFCSVGRQGGNKTCSAYGDRTRCSVAPGNRAICTSLLGAPSGSCSVQAGLASCSVLGGPNGDPCTQ